MINMMKKLLVFIISVVCSVVLLVFVWSQYRHFYQVDDMTSLYGRSWEAIAM
jgi:hypothetical protein